MAKKSVAFKPAHHIELKPFFGSLAEVAEHIQSLIAEHGKDAQLEWKIGSEVGFGYRVQPALRK